MIANVVGDCQEYTPNFTNGEKVKSPGVLYKHYSPRCQTALFAFDALEQAKNTIKEAQVQGKKIAVLAEESVLKSFSAFNVTLLNLGATEEEMANRLYDLLREAEKVCELLIAVEPKKHDGVMVGVLNRLRKACASTDIAH